jgi:hypothetical protein
MPTAHVCGEARTIVLADEPNTKPKSALALLADDQKRSSLITVGTSHGFAPSFAFLSAASHRWRVHSSATMVSATLNLPCVGHSSDMAGVRKLLGWGFADWAKERHGLRLTALYTFDVDPLTKK